MDSEPQDSNPTFETDPLALILQKLEAIDARLDKVEKRESGEGRELGEPGTIPLPEDVPPPAWPHYPWEQLDDVGRQGWIDAHRGKPGARADEAEWETIALPGGEGAEFPPAPPPVKSAWKQDAPVYFENWSPDYSKGLSLDRQGMIDAFEKGGPLWFAAYAHKFLMDLPQHMRQNMVRQVNAYAPAAGAELARDILRADTEAANSFAYEDALLVADHRKEGYVRGRDGGA